MPFIEGASFTYMLPELVVKLAYWELAIDLCTRCDFVNLEFASDQLKNDVSDT